MKRPVRLALTLATASLVVFSALPLFLPGAPSPWTALPDGLRAILPSFLTTFKGAVDLGPMPDTPITVGVALTPPDPQGADQYIQAMYTPGSPEYGQRLSATDFQAEFSPTPARYAAVERYFGSEGLSLTPTSDRFMLGLSGPSDQVANVFHTSFDRYSLSDGQVVYGPSGSVLVPSALGLDALTGFTNAVGVHPADVTPLPLPSAPARAPSNATHASSAPTATSSPSTISCTSGGFVCDMWGQYSMTSLETAGYDGAGMRVGIVDAYDSGFTQASATSTVSSWSSSNGIPTPAIQYLYPYAEGANLNGSGSNGWGGETTLDLQMVDTMAPGSTIVMDFAPDSSFGVYEAVDYLAAYNLTNTISMSWGESDVGTMHEAPQSPCLAYYSCNASWDGSYAFLHPVFQEAVAEGITPFAAAGDCGAADSTATVATDYPSSDPLVVGVGGTVLNGSGGTWAGASPWTGNGSSCTGNIGGGGGGWTPFSQPWWQHGWRIQDKTLRGDPDVAADSADGTSQASPLWAGMVGVADQLHGHGLGLIGPSLYSVYRSSSFNASFHLVNGGSNGYPCTWGWNPCTGLGDPIGSVLFPKLGANDPPPTSFAVGLTASLTSGPAPLTVDFTATVTSGGSAPFEYDFVPGLYLGEYSGRANTLAYTYQSAGAYAASVVVWDSSGNWTESLPIAITVGTGHALTVAIVPSKTKTTVGTPILYNTTVSGGTGPYQFLYFFGDGTYGPNGSASEPHVYYANGTYCAGVVAFDLGVSPSQGGSAAATCVTAAPPPHPLTASFSASPSSGSEWLHVNFTSQVYGGSGKGYAYSWSFGDGSTASTAANPYHVYSKVGTFQVNLTVTDSALNMTHAFGNVTVKLPSLTVLLSASATSGVKPLTVVFGSSVNGGALPYAYAWNFGDGSVGSAFAAPTHTYNVSGTYPVLLTVTDPVGTTAVARTNVSVTNFPALVVAATANTTSGQAPLSVSFNGSASGGEPALAWSWSFGDGGTSALENPVHVYTSPGTFPVRLSVTDQQPHTVSAYTNVTVTPAPLVASSAALPTLGAAPLLVTFNGTATGGLAPYAWSWVFGDGAPTSHFNNPVHPYNATGTYTAILTVADSAGHTSTATAISIRVNAYAVTVAATGPTGPITVGQLADFNATASGGVAPYYYTWDFGDGSSSVVKNPTHAYSAVGTYTASVVATDSAGIPSLAATLTIKVTTALPLNVVAGGSTAVNVGALATFWVYATGGAGGYTYLWQFGDGSTFTSSTTNVSSHTYSSARTFVVTVTATDRVGSSQSATTTIVVSVSSSTGTGGSNPLYGNGAPTLLAYLLIGVVALGLAALAVVLYRRSRAQGPPPLAPPGGLTPYGGPAAGPGAPPPPGYPYAPGPSAPGSPAPGYGQGGTPPA